MAKSSRINEGQHTVAHERKNGPFPRTVFSFSFSFWLEIKKFEWNGDRQMNTHTSITFGGGKLNSLTNRNVIIEQSASTRLRQHWRHHFHILLDYFLYIIHWRLATLSIWIMQRNVRFKWKI